jgi:excisionase family DNA binding protein
MADRDLLTIGEAAEALGVSVKTLRRWDAAGTIVAVRTEGGHRRFPRAEVQRQLLRREGARGDDHRLPPGRQAALARLLRTNGQRALAQTTRALDRDHATTWLSDPVGQEAVLSWLAELEGACLAGRPANAVAATVALLRKVEDNDERLGAFGARVFVSLFAARLRRTAGDPAAERECAAYFAELVPSAVRANVDIDPMIRQLPIAALGPSAELGMLVTSLASIPGVAAAAAYLLEVMGAGLRRIGASNDVMPQLGGEARAALMAALADPAPKVLTEPALRREVAPAAQRALILVVPVVAAQATLGALALAIEPDQPVHEQHLEAARILGSELATRFLGAHGTDTAAGDFANAWRSAA